MTIKRITPTPSPSRAPRARASLASSGPNPYNQRLKEVAQPCRWKPSPFFAPTFFAPVLRASRCRPTSTPAKRSWRIVESLTRQLADAEAELNDRVFAVFRLTPDEISLLRREVEH